MIDQNNDVTFSHLKNILEDIPQIREHIKEAQVGEDVRDRTSSSAFADTYNKRFPLASKADAILSKAYATKVANLAPEVMDKIDVALKIYDVSEDLFKSEKVAYAPEEPQYLVASQSKLPIYSSTQTKVAEYHLSKHIHKLKPSTLGDAAVKLVKHASSRGEEVSLDTLKYAGLVQTDISEASNWIEARAYKAEDPKHTEAYTKLSSIVSNLDNTTSRDQLIKIANTLENLDSLSGLDKYYHRNLPDSISTIFNTKTAMAPSVEMAGKQIGLEKLLAIDPSVYGDILGSDIVEEITENGEIDSQKLIEVFETLPADMKQLLVEKLSL
mgnify:CR=1 FL=1|tara:strand:- start:32474 stop:33454 length:981 start_codon:yes stop_codon:yes gene_type:complete